MEIRIQILAITASLCLLIGVIHLVRKRVLRPEYSVVWLVGTSALLLISLWRDILDQMAEAVGIHYAPAVLLLVGIFFGILGFLHLSVVLSRQTDCNRTLVQQIALMEHRLDSLEREVSRKGPAD